MGPDGEDDEGRVLGRDELLHALVALAPPHALAACGDDEGGLPRVTIGMVGFPNVGKSSVINALAAASARDHGRGGATRVGVGATPGKTKHFQTVELGVLPLQRRARRRRRRGCLLEPNRRRRRRRRRRVRRRRRRQTVSPTTTTTTTRPTATRADGLGRRRAGAPAGVRARRRRGSFARARDAVRLPRPRVPVARLVGREMLVCGVLPINTMAMRDALPPAALIAARAAARARRRTGCRRAPRARRGRRPARGRARRRDAVAGRPSCSTRSRRARLPRPLGRARWARAVRKLVIDYIAGALLHCDPPPAPPRDAATGEAEAAAAAAPRPRRSAPTRSRPRCAATHGCAPSSRKRAAARPRTPRHRRRPARPQPAVAEDAELVAAAAPTPFDELLLPAAPAAPPRAAARSSGARRAASCGQGPVRRGRRGPPLAREAARSAAPARSQGPRRAYTAAVRCERATRWRSTGGNPRLDLCRACPLVDRGCPHHREAAARVALGLAQVGGRRFRVTPRRHRLCAPPLLPELCIGWGHAPFRSSSFDGLRGLSLEG